MKTGIITGVKEENQKQIQISLSRKEENLVPDKNNH